MEWLTKVTLTINDVEVSSDTEIDVNEINKVQLSYQFKIKDIAEDGPTISAGSTATFKLPEGFILPEQLEESYPVEVEDETKITYTIGQDGTITIHFIGDFDKDDRQLGINLNLFLDNQKLENGGNLEINIPYAEGSSFSLTLKKEETEYQGKDKKEGVTFRYDESGNEILTKERPTHARWTVRVNEKYKELTNAILTDDFGEDQTYVEGTLEVIEITKTSNSEKREVVTDKFSVEVDLDKEGFNLTLGNISKTYEISYVTEIAEQKLGSDLTVNNNAKLTYGDDKEIDLPGSVEDVNWGKNSEVLQKDAEYTMGSDRITWTIKYNYNGENRGETQTLIDILSLGKFDENTLKIYQITTDINGIEQTRTELEGWQYKIEDKKLELTVPGNQPLLITYDTNVPPYIESNVKNSIQEKNEEEPVEKEISVNTKPTLTKRADVQIDEEGRPYIDWTIVANSNRVNLNKLVFQDTFNRLYLRLDESSLKLTRKDKDGASEPAEGKYFGILGELIRFNYTVVNPGPYEYTLTYRTYYTDLGLKQDKVTNNVKIVGNNDKGITAEAKKPSIVVEKTGGYAVSEKGNNIIDWKIVFNRNKLVLTDAKIVDTWNQKLELIGDVKISVGDHTLGKQDYSFKKEDNGFVITLKGKTQPSEYTLEYTTSDFKENTDNIKNTVTIKDKFGFSGTTEKTVEQRKPRLNKIGNWRVDESGEIIIDQQGNKLIDWEIEIATPKYKLEDVTVTDTYRDEKTKEVAIVEGANGIKVYQGNSTTPMNITPILDSHQFTIQLGTMERTTYKIKYTTTYPKEIQKQNAVNSLNVSYRGKSDGDTIRSTKKHPELKVEKKGEVTKREQPYEITWTVQANTDKENHLVYLVDAELKDTIESGQELIEDSVKVINKKTKEAIEPINVKYDSKSKQLVISLPDGLNQYEMSYKTKVTEYTEEHYAKGYHNGVTLTNQTKTNQLKDEAYAEDSVKIFSGEGPNNNPNKSGEQNPLTEDIDWQAIVNKQSMPIKNAKINDQLTGPQEYIEESIKIYPGSSKTPLASDAYEITFNAEKTGFVIQLKDRDEEETAGNVSMPYTIKYSTRLTKAAGIGEVIVKNSIALNGEQGGKVDDSTSPEITVESFSTDGFAGGRLAHFRLLKQDKSNDDKVLSGVEFKLFRIMAQKEIFVADLKTNEKGFAEITKINRGMYVLKETKANVGYDLLEDSIKFTIIYSKEGKPEIVKENDDSSNVDKEDPSLLIIKNQRSVNAPEIIDIPVQKQWEISKADAQPKEITVGLYDEQGNLIRAEDVVNPITLENSSWKNGFYNVPKYTDEGIEIKYQIRELTVDGKDVWLSNYRPDKSVYEVRSNEEGINPVVITNHDAPVAPIPELTNVPVQKVWVDGNNADNKRPNSVTVQLVKDNVETGQVLQLSSANNWRASFSGLVKYDGLREIVYSVKEVAVPEYVGTTIGNATTGFTITNTLVQTLSGEKIWNDGNDEAKLRPSAITIHLQANGTTVSTQTVHADAAGKWSYQFTQVPKYDAGSNKELVYTVLEDAVANYTPTYDGLNVTNTLVKEEVKPLEPTPKPDDTKDPLDGSTDSKEDPIIPDEQTKPLQPGEKPEASKPTTTGKKLPQTGEEFNWIWSLIGSLVLVTLGGYVVIRRQRMKKESE